MPTLTAVMPPLAMTNEPCDAEEFLVCFLGNVDFSNPIMPSELVNSDYI